MKYELRCPRERESFELFAETKICRGKRASKKKERKMVINQKRSFEGKMKCEIIYRRDRRSEGLRDVVAWLRESIVIDSTLVKEHFLLFGSLG